MREVYTIGLDIAKNKFQAHGEDKHGKKMFEGVNKIMTWHVFCTRQSHEHNTKLRPLHKAHARPFMTVLPVFLEILLLSWITFPVFYAFFHYFLPFCHILDALLLSKAQCSSTDEVV